MNTSLRSQQIRRRNTMLRELAELVGEALEKEGVQAARAVAVSQEIAFQIHQRWKGITFTFPVRDDLARTRLEAHLAAEYTGANADELARRYGVTEDFIYKVLRDRRRKRTAPDNQGEFPF